MTHDDFNASVVNFLSATNEMIVAKNADYAGGQDPFAAFDETALTLGLTREQVWAVFWMKHVRAVLKWVESGELASEDIRSRLLDLAAYPAILYASIMEDNAPTD